MLENEILLIGLGPNKNNLNTIIENPSLSEIGDIFGSTSCFYKALSEIRKISDTKVDVLNLDDWEEIKDQEEILNGYCYDYVVPIDLYIEEMYFDEFYGINMLYSQLIVMLLSKSISTVIMTGKHASNYEDLDQYLEYENSNITIAEKVFNNLRKENIVYVSNGLKNFQYANAVLAAMMTITDYDDYPAFSNLGEACFDIDFCDINNELCYFRNNYLQNTSVENLVNFSTNDVLKLVSVYKIIKYFYYHRADVDQYIGTAYTDYKLMKIMEAEQEFLENCVGWIIYKYDFQSITPVMDEYGAIEIRISFDIWPHFTTEKYTIEISL